MMSCLLEQVTPPDTSGGAQIPTNLFVFLRSPALFAVFAVLGLRTVLFVTLFIIHFGARTIRN